MTRVRPNGTVDVVYKADRSTSEEVKMSMVRAVRENKGKTPRKKKKKEETKEMRDETETGGKPEPEEANKTVAKPKAAPAPKAAKTTKTVQRPEIADAPETPADKAPEIDNYDQKKKVRVGG